MGNVIQIIDPKLYTLLKEDLLEGVNVRLKPVAASRDFGAGEIVFTIIITIVTGIPTSIIANWIYDKMKKTKVSQLTLNKRVIEIKDESSIKIIEESIIISNKDN